MDNGNNNGKGYFATAQEAFNALRKTERTSIYDKNKDRLRDTGSVGPINYKKRKGDVLEARINYALSHKEEVLKLMNDDYNKKKVKGTGKNGKVTENDLILAYANNGDYTTKTGIEYNATKILKGSGYSVLAGQCPTRKTAGRFFGVLRDKGRISAVVNLCPGQDKCPDYWDSNKYEKIKKKFVSGDDFWYTTMDGLGVYWKASPEKLFVEDVTKVELTLGHVDKKLDRCVMDKKIPLFLVHGWPDHDTPKNGDALEDFVKSQTIQNQRSLMVHCRGGVGRTGAFCACFEAIKQINKGVSPNPYKIVNEMRKFRNAMVQEQVQFDFVCRFIIRNDPELEKKWPAGKKPGWKDPFDYKYYFEDGDGYSFRSNIYVNTPYDKA